MNKQWLSHLADDIMKRFGKETSTRIFGDIDGIAHTPECLSAWFENFTSEMDNINDKAFLQQMMANRSPCGGDYEIDGKAMKAHYENSDTLAEFVDVNRKWMHDKYGDTDLMELSGNVLYMTKPLGASTDTGRCGRGCHCWLAMHTNRTVSDTFCYCCTIGHTGRPFKIAFGDDIRMDFIESIICGGKACVMAIHLPEKDMPVKTAV
jgi:hypothetical protein